MLGVTSPTEDPPPSDLMGTATTIMAPVSRAIAAEVERAAAAPAGPDSGPESGSTLTSAGRTTRGATKAIEQELRKAGAI